MKKLVVPFLLVISFVTGGLSQDYTASLNADKMRERVKRLSADEMEGRAPGNAGGRRAAQYIADELKAAGVRPGNGNSYLQNVRLVGVKSDPGTSLHVSSDKGDPESLKFGDQFVAWTDAQKPEVTVD